MKREEIKGKRELERGKRGEIMRGRIVKGIVMVMVMMVMGCNSGGVAGGEGKVDLAKKNSFLESLIAIGEGFQEIFVGFGSALPFFSLSSSLLSLPSPLSFPLLFSLLFFLLSFSSSPYFIIYFFLAYLLKIRSKKYDLHNIYTLQIKKRALLLSLTNFLISKYSKYF
ncbi:hypothetical protein Q7M_1545 (plasmid) [Borrelia crocidurae str. Achema]|uniref:Variable outer membrane protein n=1 Tax=Borrelia crocidurae (strain Achema) TaxID=1155096 RepID=I0FDY2_BORCA|nr:hypothetical protein Q7M_1545 [Borrelia crocidurae str. Achema]